GAIVGETTPYRRTCAAAREAVELIRDAVREERLVLPKRESGWLDKIGSALDSLPEREEDLIGPMIDAYGTLFHPSGYGL
ncbi:MAG TPA: methyltransferase MtaB domain-containing protein, partial [Bacteroidota bacterium]|nr:methyltransferase MtaB domain-containing protein [Bacteroidota bacterium]